MLSAISHIYIIFGIPIQSYLFHTRRKRVMSSMSNKKSLLVHEDTYAPTKGLKAPSQVRHDPWPVNFMVAFSWSLWYSMIHGSSMHTYVSYLILNSVYEKPINWCFRRFMFLGYTRIVSLPYSHSHHHVIRPTIQTFWKRSPKKKACNTSLQSNLCHQSLWINHQQAGCCLCLP